MKTQIQILLVGLLLVANGANAQSNPAALQAEAEAALVRGDPGEAARVARMLSETQPDAFAPAFILALALFDAGEFDAAAHAAALSYGNATTPREKQQAAQLAGNAWFAAKAFTRAAFWLRRAANHVETEDDLRIIAETYGAVRAANPLNVQVGAWVSPTDNINSGAESEVFQLEGLPFDFVLPADRVALSGLEYGLDVAATYRLARTSEQTTAIGVYVFGQSYLLSSESSTAAPEVSGSDFSYLATDLSLTHERLLFEGHGPSSIALNGGRVWSSGVPTWDYATLALQQGIILSESATLTLRTARTRQVSLTGAAPVDIIQASGTLRHQFATGDLAEARLSGLYSDGGFENIYAEVSGEVGYTWDEPFEGVQVSANLMLGYRSYETFPTTLDGRRDRFGRIGFEALFSGISYWGFSPRLSMGAERTVSTAEEFTSRSLSAQIGVTSNF